MSGWDGGAHHVAIQRAKERRLVTNLEDFHATSLAQRRSGVPQVRRAWAAQIPSAEMFVSAITIHELEHGVLLMERSDPGQGAMLRAWLDQSVAAAFAARVLPVDERVARRAAALHVPDPAPGREALIGGTALAHGMTDVTRDMKDFNRFDGLDVINPWR